MGALPLMGEGPLSSAWLRGRMEEVAEWDECIGVLEGSEASGRARTAELAACRARRVEGLLDEWLPIGNGCGPPAGRPLLPYERPPSTPPSATLSEADPTTPPLSAAIPELAAQQAPRPATASEASRSRG